MFSKVLKSVKQAASNVDPSVVALNNAYDRILSDNQNSAREQMAFQERMSNTAHQREVKDLIAAGLNPVLSANAGASTPAGSYSAVDGSSLTAAGNARLQKSLLKDQLDNQIKINKAQIDAQKAISKYQTDVGAEVQKYSAQISAAASKYASDNAYASSIYGSNVSSAINSANIENQRWMAQNYPSNKTEAFSSLLHSYTSGKAQSFASSVKRSWQKLKYGGGLGGSTRPGLGAGRRK